MGRGSRLLLLSALFASGLAGCGGGGSGGELLGFFGGGDVSSAIASLFGGDSDGDLGLLAGSFGTDLGSGGNGSNGNSGSGDVDTPPGLTESVGSVHSPEPASLGLFGLGMFGLGLWRRGRGYKAPPQRA